jgi:hypothetical protein
VVQSAGSPTGTTSVWPLNPRTRRAFRGPQRAKRFGVPLRSTRVQAKPPPLSMRSSSRSAPPSSGVTLGQRTSAAVRSTGSVDMEKPPDAVAWLWVTPWRERHNDRGSAQPEVARRRPRLVSLMKQTKKPSNKTSRQARRRSRGHGQGNSKTTDGVSARRARRKSDPSFADRLPEFRQDGTWRPGRS